MSKGKWKRGGQEKIPNDAVYAVLRVVLPDRDAKVLAGYSKNSHCGKLNIKRYALTVDEVRQRLSDMPGLVSYLDQIAKLARVQEESLDDGDRDSFLAAARTINKMQGYDAPQKIEVDQRSRITIADMEIKAIMTEYGVQPEEIRKELERRKQIKEVEFKEIPGIEAVNVSRETLVEVSGK